ncbi:MAG: dTMP kinase [Bacilli bacterium]
MGKLIVIEGSCDGVGKSTQYKMLIDRLSKEQEKVITTHHFPSYGTYQGRPVEEYLKGNYGKISELSPYFVNSLYAQDRAITWISGLKQEYQKGSTIILDRYTTSSLIYQSSVIDKTSEKEKFIDYVYDYEYNKLGIPEPDLVIFLHAPFEVIKSLKEKRKDNDGIKNDIHERDLAFMKKVSDTAVELAKKFGWSFIECTENGKMRSIDDIHKDIYNLVSKLP